MALVKLATKSIETKLFVNQFKDELILSFHPRQEYLSTNSVGLLAINGDGFVVGSNSNARIMLHGLVRLKNESFNNIFTTSFSSIANELYGKNIGLISYGLATLVAVSRMNDNKHYLSDVIFGAGLGTAVGRAFAINYQKFEETNIQVGLSSQMALKISIPIK